MSIRHKPISKKSSEEMLKIANEIFFDEYNRNLKDGESCGHPGCLAHTSHPCRVCGRIKGGKK